MEDVKSERPRLSIRKRTPDTETTLESYEEALCEFGEDTRTRLSRVQDHTADPK